MDSEIRACLDLNAGLPISNPLETSLHEARAAFEENRAYWNDEAPEMCRSTASAIETADFDLSVVEHVPLQAVPGSILFLHGGGWITGSNRSHEGIMRRLAQSARRRVIGIDYPLAPEHRRPQVIKSCAQAIGSLMRRSRGPHVLAGDSAGAELSIASCLELQDAGNPLPAGLALIYPALWPRFDTSSHESWGDGRFGLSTDKMRFFWNAYLGDDGHALDDEPDLQALPQCLVLGAEHDCLLDDANKLSALLTAARVPVELWVAPGAVHGFLHYAKKARIARDAIVRIATFVDRVCRASSDGRPDHVPSHL